VSGELGRCERCGRPVLAGTTCRVCAAADAAPAPEYPAQPRTNSRNVVVLLAVLVAVVGGLAFFAWATQEHERKTAAFYATSTSTASTSPPSVLPAAQVASIDAHLREWAAAFDLDIYVETTASGESVYVKTKLYPKASNTGLACSIVQEVGDLLVNAGYGAVTVWVEAADGRYLAASRGSAGVDGRVTGCAQNVGPR
jgi:hypothetical protein